ncbi:hypothetical protein B5X24_HaOG207788 [Helicoverpa armigera]|nr:hypothetical protein B5X24_HaOG207788 [Helicoverpa armigera]
MKFYIINHSAIPIIIFYVLPESKVNSKFTNTENQYKAKGAGDGEQRQRRHAPPHTGSHPHALQQTINNYKNMYYIITLNPSPCERRPVPNSGTIKKDRFDEAKWFISLA